MGKKSKRTRSPSASSSAPSTSPSRSRRSPKHARIKIKQEKGSPDMSSKITSYFESRAKLSADLLTMKIEFASNPSSHPDYKSLWAKFYERKQKKAKKPLSIKDLQPVWAVKWRKIIDDWYDNELTCGSKKLRRSLGLKKKALRRVKLKVEYPEENHEMEGSEDGEIGSPPIRNKRSPPASQSLPGSQSPPTKRDSLSVKILETLVFLSDYKSFLGEWDDRVETARRLCVKVEAEGPGECVRALKDERFALLLDGCMQALETSLKSGSLRRTREIEDGMRKMRYLRPLAKDSHTELSPESPSSVRHEKHDRQPRQTSSITASVPEAVEAQAAATTRMIPTAAPVEHESVIRTLRLLSSLKECLDEIKIEIEEYLKIANTLEFEKGPNGSDLLLTDSRFLNVIYRVNTKLLYLVVLDNPMLLQECKKSVISLLSRASLASASNSLMMPHLPPRGFNPLITGHPAQPFTMTNSSHPFMIPQAPQAMMGQGTHPLMMTHGAQPMMPCGAQSLMGNCSQIQAMREAVFKFSESIRRPNNGQKDVRFPGLRSSTPIEDLSPIPPIGPRNNFQMTHDHDKMHNQFNQQRGWFQVNPAGSFQPNKTPNGFKGPGIAPTHRPTDHHQPRPLLPQRSRPSATAVSGALLGSSSTPQNILSTAISTTLKEVFGSSQNLSGEMMKKIESRVRKSIVHIKQEISEVQDGQQSSNSSIDIAGDLGTRLKRFDKLDVKQRCQLIKEIHNLSVENPEALKDVNALKENLL